MLSGKNLTPQHKETDLIVLSGSIPFITGDIENDKAILDNLFMAAASL